MGSNTLRELRQDLGYGLRMLRRTPMFTAVAVLTLALGIGANSAIFTVVNGVLLESLPYPAAERLYRVQTIYPDATGYPLSAPDFMSVRQDARVFERVEAYGLGAFTMLGVGEPRELIGLRVSDGLADLLGWRMQAGRPFELGDFTPGRGRVLILDHGFWLREFGGSQSALGQKVTLGGDPYVIIGVLAPGARAPMAVEAYAPLEYNNTFNASTATSRRGEYLTVLGRAKAGVDAAAISEDLRRVGTSLQTTFKSTNDGLTFGSTSLVEATVGDVRTPLLVLLGAVGCVLLIACANVANLLLARVSVRQDEIAVRAALGAGRSRIVRQLVTEAVLLSVLGGALGLLIAYAGTSALTSAQPADIPRLDAIHVNLRIVLFTFALSVATGLVFGVVPAVRATGQLSRAVRQGARSGGVTASEYRFRGTLVVAEMALAVALLTGAGLLIRSFVALTQVSPGFQAEHALSFRILLQGPGYPGVQQMRSRVADIESRLRVLPGVTDVGVSTVLPLRGNGSMLGFAVEGAPPPPPNVNAEIAVASVSPGYFPAIRGTLRSGRWLTAQDNAGAPPVALINQAGVTRWFAGVDPLRRFVQVNSQRIEVVGVVGDVLQRDPGSPAAPQLYVPYEQRTTRSIRVVVRAAGDAASQTSAVRSVLHGVDPNLPVLTVRTLSDLVADSVARPRFYMGLLGLFASVALVLAATGIFGVMSYTVAQRAREIGIRIALGASPAEIRRRIVGSGLALAGAGAVLGIGGALALGRVLQGQLFGVGVVDPVTLVTVVGVLGLSAVLATWLPARRAAKLDPAEILR